MQLDCGVGHINSQLERATGPNAANARAEVAAHSNCFAASGPDVPNGVGEGVALVPTLAAVGGVVGPSDEVGRDGAACG